MSQRDRHRAKMQERARVGKLASGLANTFSKFIEDRGLVGTRWDSSTDEVRKMLVLFLMQVLHLTAKRSRLLALAVVNTSATRVAVDMQRLAKLVLAQADKDRPRVDGAKEQHQ
jgi:hypothetical protein